jgi:hypothetical protein
VFAKYKQRKDQSVRDYIEASTYLAAQLPEDYLLVERAITYLTGIELSMQAYLLVHQSPHTFKEVVYIAICIKSNAELLGTGLAFADGLVRHLKDDCP